MFDVLLSFVEYTEYGWFPDGTNNYLPHFERLRHEYPRNFHIKDALESLFLDPPLQMIGRVFHVDEEG